MCRISQVNKSRSQTVACTELGRAVVVQYYLTVCYCDAVKRTAEDGSGDTDKKKPRLEVI